KGNFWCGVPIQIQDHIYKDIAKKKKILESGGNDHHGRYRDTLGLLDIPYEVLKNLKKLNK
ncbi:hypothetical protein CMO83_03830, partial [Candidatus Woesearchaeota archaeon]|nr:hypothetical protein [Candidatus Woesearchaeota archaeon]